MIASELAGRRRSVRFDDVARGARASVTRARSIVATRPARRTLAALRDEPELELDFLSSVTARTGPVRDPRFWMAYHLYVARPTATGSG